MTTNRRILTRLGRTLSIDLRSRRVAWTLFRDSTILDQHIKTVRNTNLVVRMEHETAPYLMALLEELAPHALLVPETEPAGARRRSVHSARCIERLVAEAHLRGVAVHVVDNRAVKAAFTDCFGNEAKNKRDIHERIIEEFPEMQLVLPKPRAKLWDSEEYFEPLFHTVAMFLAWRQQPSPMDRRRGLA